MLLYSIIFTNVASRINLSFLSFIKYSFTWFNLLRRRRVNATLLKNVDYVTYILLCYNTKNMRKKFTGLIKKEKRIAIIEL